MGLNDEDKQRLRGLGVTDAQMRKLARKLPSIARALNAPPTRSDVLDVLKDAEKAAAKLMRIADAKALPAHREALAHLASASALVECEPGDDSGDGTLPEVPDFGAAARMLLDMARKAQNEVPKGQRRGRRNPGRAVSMLLAALAEPDDPESHALAKRAQPVHAASKRNPFAEIAGIVFAQAEGADASEVRAAVDAWHKLPARGKRAVPKPDGATLLVMRVRSG